MKIIFHRSQMCWAVLLCLVSLTCTWAQQTPHIGYVYPAGGQRGTTFSVVVGGQYLNNATNVFFTGNGISCVFNEQERQLTPDEERTLRDKLSLIQEKRKKGESPSTEEKKNIEEIRKMLMMYSRRRTNPAIGEFVPLIVTISSNAVPGNREIRLGTATGLSNPLLFRVGELPEYSKEEWKNIPELFNRMKPKKPEQTVIDIKLPATLNGQIPPGGVDRYRFHAQRGQHIVVATSARELIPYLADAVPGWFQATLTLFDSQTNEVAYADDYRFHPDPVLFYEIPKDGDYTLEIKDSLYRGREDFVYRISVGELPFVTCVYPLGGRVGASVPYELRGWNLLSLGGTLNLSNATLGVYPISVKNRDIRSNYIPFSVDDIPEVSEKEPNNTLANAQSMKLPVIINGRINQPNDVDVFRFEGRKGDEVVGEVNARRLDSPLDSVLKLTDANGKQLAFNDDHEDKGSGLNTHHADSYIRFKLPSDGTYYFWLSDAQHKGGVPYAYRLRLSAPRPDFALRVVPSSIAVRGAMSTPLTVYALRRDGFTNEIAIALKEAPEGFKLTGAVVPAGQDQARITLSVSGAVTAKEPLPLHLEGKATVQGTEVAHEAVPAEDMMQAFAYRHLVPSQELEVMVARRGEGRPPIKILSPTPVKIPAGGTAVVSVGIPAEIFQRKVRLELSNPPEGISIQNFSSKQGQTEIVFAADKTKVTTGLTGSLIVNVVLERPEAKRQPPPIGTLPAIPYVIVGK